MKMKVYEYPLKRNDGTIYNGSYTIRDGIKRLGFKGERLVQVFEYDYSENNHLRNNR